MAPSRQEKQKVDDEINRRFEMINQNSGKLMINNILYENVTSDQIHPLVSLGAGNFGKVNKVKLGINLMAEKSMNRSDSREETRRILADLYAVRQTNECPFIVKCYGYIITEHKVKIYMELMQMCCEKLLSDRGFVGLPEKVIGQITMSVAKALQFLKENLKLMHRDLKPSNILLSYNGHIKLCDFNISGQLIDSIAASTTRGAFCYLAPERIQHQQYGAKADVWSLGMTLVHLAQGTFPNEHYGNPKVEMELMIKIESDPPPQLNPKNDFSSEFCDFVAQCLKKDPKNRSKVNELIDLPFLVNSIKEKVDVEHFLENQELYEPKPKNQ